MTATPRRRSHRAVAGLVPLALALALASLVVAPSGASGPALTVPTRPVLAALHCTGDLARSEHRPVLFLHGTTSDSRANWSWNWARALDARRWAHCELDLPRNGNGDIQRSAEYVTRAIRIMHDRAGQRISMVGHSQGGMIARWSLKYWPDTRAMVDDYVALAPSNHGSLEINLQCAFACSAAAWQQRPGSAFLTALNAGRETWPGVSYTNITTRYDGIHPYTGSYLRGEARLVTNTIIQDLCPAQYAGHFEMAFNHTAWLIGLDALVHHGPARLRRIKDPDCGRVLMPGVNPTTFPTDYAAALAKTVQSSLSAAQLREEPPLRRYAR